MKLIAEITVVLTLIGAICFTSCSSSPLSVSITPTSVTIYEGEDASLAAQVIVEKPGRTRVIWNSSDDSVAIVDEQGVVSGLKCGSTVITACSDGISASAVVTVKSSAALNREIKRN